MLLGCFFSSLLMTETFAENYISMSKDYKLTATNIWGYMGALQSTLMHSDTNVLTYVPTGFAIWRSDNSHLSGKYIRQLKKIHMLEVAYSLKIDNETKNKVFSLIEKNYWSVFPRCPDCRMHHAKCCPGSYDITRGGIPEFPTGNF